jgi:hypothetical protein
MDNQLSSSSLMLPAGAGQQRGEGVEQAAPGRRVRGQLLGMCDAHPPDNETEMKVSVFVSKTSACLKK